MPIPPILHSDPTMLVIDKPAGLPVAAGLVAQVQAAHGAEVRPAHRLDPEVGGPVVFARTKPALDFLSGQFQSKTALADWMAIIVVASAEEAVRPAKMVRDDSGGIPAEFLLEWPLIEDAETNGRWCIAKRNQGRAAETRGRLIEALGRYALLDCQAPTTPVHQVRVHLATAGFPVLNDAAYGLPGVSLRLSDLKRGYKGRDEERPLIATLALHVVRLSLRHPETREPMTIESAAPKEFEVALKNLRKFRRAR